MMQQTQSGLWVPDSAFLEHLQEYDLPAREKAVELTDLLRSGELIEKSDNAPALRQPKSRLFDPLSLVYSMGYKDRRQGISYQVIRRVVKQLSIVAAIINTRIAQVESFCTPYRLTRTTGFMVKMKDPTKKPNASDVKRILEIEDFISRCGRPQQNKFSRGALNRSGFSDFTKKYMRDSLELDQGTFEIVPDRTRRPFEFIATDGATFRIAADDPELGYDYHTYGRRHLPPTAIEATYYGGGNTNRIAAAMRALKSNNIQIAYVQVLHGQIENVYTEDELAFGVRNPRADLTCNGYGLSEVEQLVTVVTSYLYAEEYNRAQFSSNSIPKGVLNLRGENITPDQFDQFKRAWTAMVSGVNNAWRAPVMQADQVQWIPFMQNNKDMEFQAWLEYLTKICCAIWLVDPAEINFDTRSSMQSSQPLFTETSMENRVKKSRDRGLHPLLRYYAKELNRNIVDKIDDRYYLDFVGLDELSQKERMEIRQQELTLFRTLNEVREEEDLPPLKSVEELQQSPGDIPMSPTFIQFLQYLETKKQQDMQVQAQQQEMQAAVGGAPPGGAPASGAPPAAGGGAPPTGPIPEVPEEEFTRSFNAKKNGKYLEIELED